MINLRYVKFSREQTEIPLVGILDRLHAQEDGCTPQRCPQQRHQQTMLSELRGPHSPSHGQRTEQQNPGVDRTKLLVQKSAAIVENIRVLATQQGVRTEHAAEEQYFRHQEQPHSEFARVKLLLGIVEMVSQPCGMIMLVCMIVIYVAVMPTETVDSVIAILPSTGQTDDLAIYYL